MGKNAKPLVEGTNFVDVIDLGYIDGDGTIVSSDAEDIFAYDGDDFVHSGGGNDRIWGGNGDDTLEGGGGGDSLYGGDGNDLLLGGSGADKLYGENGDDFLFGGGSHDLLQGGAGNDTLRGGGGNDRLYGNKGNNDLRGEGGDDFISTGDHTSIANGGDGDDTLEIRMKKGGDHVLTGGLGADDFQFVQSASSGISDAVITDFDLDLDTFSIDGTDGAAYLQEIGAGNVHAWVDDTVVVLLTGDTITFEGIDEATFEAHFDLV